MGREAVGFGRALLQLCVPGVIVASRLKLKAKGFGFFGGFFFFAFSPPTLCCGVCWCGCCP